MERQFDNRGALAFILAFGVVSLFGDMAHEGMRGLNGEYLAGYLIRLFSGRVARSSGAYWALSVGGYALTMATVPAMAFVLGRQSAALLVVLERAGKAIRGPANGTMQARAGDRAARE